MQKWEYFIITASKDGIIFSSKILRVNGEGLLKSVVTYGHIKDLGQQGWELVSVTENTEANTLYFKRPISN